MNGQKMQRILPLLLVAAIATGCATNPVTGQRELSLVSEQQELAMGQQAHHQVIAEYKVYDEKPELSRLVNEIGQRIASTSERPNLPWTFTILDTGMVNAMALPGGYIYITRGMLERINSNDELAGVLGHEIAHVTARHAAQRISRAQLTQLGLVLGSAVAGPAATQQYGQFAELGAALLFQRYSRAQETQADLVGTSYMAGVGYNPLGAERMLIALQRLSRIEGSAVERYFASHPDPAQRVRDVRRRSEEIQQATPNNVFTPLERNQFLRLTEGMITGNSTQHVVIANNVIHDRAHGMVLPVPAGWVATTAPGVLFAIQPQQQNVRAQFVVQEVDLRTLGANQATARDAVRQRLQQMGLTYAGSREVTAGTRERFTVDVWSGRTQQGTVGVETTQFVHGDHVAVMMFISPNISRAQSPLSTVIDSMRFDAAAARAVNPPRIRLGTFAAGDSWAAVAQRATGNARDAEVIANINGFAGDQTPPAGTLVKLPQELAVGPR
jgi:predicted Zn-dependent protease